LAGFSFGARIALRLACAAAESEKPRRVIAVGFPTVFRDRSYLEGCTVPRLFVQSTNDQYGPLPDLETMVSALPEPKRLVVVEARDHFFSGALEVLEAEIAALT